MPTINQLPRLDSLASGDQLPVYATAQGDSRRMSVELLQDYMQDNLNLPDNSDEVNFLQAGTGAVTRTVQAKLRDVVSVKDFGAVGDGVADDTAAIQAALNNGGDIYIPDGTYVTLPLTASSNTRLNLSANTILKAKTGYGVNDRLLNVINVTNFQMWGGTIQMLRAEYAGVVNEQRHCVIVSGSSDVKFVGVTAIDSGGDGFYIGGAGACVNVLLQDCVADNHFRNSCSITRGSNIQVVRGRFSRANGTTEAPFGPWAGIDVEPNAGTTLSGVVIDGAEVYDNDGVGILASGPSAALITDLSIRNCKVHDNGSHGIHPNYTLQAEVIDNEVKSNAGSGIIDSTTTATQMTIRGNLVLNNGSYGIKGFVSNAVVSENLVINAVDDGINWRFGQGTTISNNVLQTIGGHGIYQERAYNAAIDGNVLRSIQKHGIYITGTVTFSSTRSRNWSVSGNAVYGAGLLTDNTYSGIYADTYANTGVINSNAIRRDDAGNQPQYAIYAADATVFSSGNETSLGAKAGNTQISIGGIAAPSYVNNVDVMGVKAIVRTYITSTVWQGGGPGSPEGAQAGGIGSTWCRTDGGAGTSFYVKESGAGNTGWVAK